MAGGPLVARVVPDVSGLDKHFDYIVPAHLVDRTAVGSLVRVELHGRRVGGWVTALGAEPDIAVSRLQSLSRWSSCGPAADVVELCRWVAQRWGSPRVAAALRTASPPRNIDATPPACYRRCRPGGLSRAGDGTRRIPPAADPLPTIIQSIGEAPALVLHPSPSACAAIARRLRAAGFSVAVLPDDWATAAGGVDVVVGGRSASLGPRPDLGIVVVLDEHDEAFQEQRSPTWHARDVAIERARRCGATVVLTSPCPTVEAARLGRGVVGVSLADEREGWPAVHVIDRQDEPPWKRSLVSSALIAELRSDRRVVCVVNRLGRARLLACRSCRAVQRCERCTSAVTQRANGDLICGRCDTARPVVCQACGSAAMANVRPGVSRLREELEAAAGRSVGELTGSDGDVPATDVVVGTEAALHRMGAVDRVVFLDFDAELLAPRFRAGEQAMTLLARAARLVGKRSRGGAILVQTTLPEHPVVRAALLASPPINLEAEMATRRQLDLPPFAALASVTGHGAADFVASTGLTWSGSADETLVRAESWDELGRRLATTPRPAGSRLRVAVDPLRG
jgi:primosomal protein N' (replication factor Y)